MTWWIIETEGGEVEQLADAPGTMGNPEGVRSAELPRLLDLSCERWDWEAAAIVNRLSPEEAAAVMHERAKAYREDDRFFATVPVAGVVPGEIVMVECHGNSRTKVSGFAELATWAKSLGAPYSLKFQDGLNREFICNADQVIGLKAALTINDGLCFNACRAVRAGIVAALAADASADEILALDVTAGYPVDPIVPPMPVLPPVPETEN